jgi:hypothetical protein
MPRCIVFLKVPLLPCASHNFYEKTDCTDEATVL